MLSKADPFLIFPNACNDGWIFANASSSIENRRSNSYNEMKWNGSNQHIDQMPKSFSILLTGSHWSVCKFIRSVRLAFVTSVTCWPPLGPPVKFYNLFKIKNENVLFRFFDFCEFLMLTHVSQESMVPAKHVFCLNASLMCGTLSFNHMIFNAEK